MLNDRERSTRLVCLKLERDPNAWTEVESVALLWADHEPLLRHAIASSELAVTQPAAHEATSSAGARPHSGYRPNLWSPASRRSSIRLRNGQLLRFWSSTSAPGALCLTDSLLSALAPRALPRELAPCALHAPVACSADIQRFPWPRRNPARSRLLRAPASVATISLSAGWPLPGGSAWASTGNCRAEANGVGEPRRR